MHFSEATSQKLKLAIFAFSIRQGKCIEYDYGGCLGTKNLFNSKSACDDACPLKEEVGLRSALVQPMWIQPPFCQAPPVIGLMACMGFSRKFTFNATQGQCVPYVYGGCGGSKNLFGNEAECQKTCDRDYNNDTPKLLDVCSLAIDMGPCRMAKPMFAFNKETKRCEKFHYGGITDNNKTENPSSPYPRVIY
jgi:hypothetical protein